MEHVKMRHCSSVVDVDTRRSFEGPFSETAWSTVHCWRRSRRLALATVNLGALNATQAYDGM